MPGSDVDPATPDPEGRTSRSRPWDLLDARRWVWLLPVVVGVVVVMTALGISGSSAPAADPQEVRLVGHHRHVATDPLRRVAGPHPVDRRAGRAGLPPLRRGRASAPTTCRCCPTSRPSTGRRSSARTSGRSSCSRSRTGSPFEWWASAAILILGVYAFLLVVLRDWRWAALGSLALYGSPFFHWWYSPTTFATVGWAAMAVAVLFCVAPRRAPGLASVGPGRLAGYFTACFGLFLYPPSQIPVALVLVTVAVGRRVVGRGQRHHHVAARRGQLGDRRGHGAGRARGLRRHRSAGADRDRQHGLPGDRVVAGETARSTPGQRVVLGGSTS